MYRTEFCKGGWAKYAGDSYYADVSFDGERFLLNESKVEKFETDFKSEEIASCCLPYHMVGNRSCYEALFNSQWSWYPYCQLLNATDTRLLWLIVRPEKCKNQNCPIQNCAYDFDLLVEQDYLTLSRNGNFRGNKYKNSCVK